MEIRIVIDDRIVSACRLLRAIATRRRVAVIASTAVLGSAVFAIAAPVEKPHDFTAGNPAVAAEVNANFDAIYTAFNDRVIREDRTIDVDNCEDLPTALADLDDYRIGSTAIVTIELAGGIHPCAGSIGVSHPNGDRLRIVGGGNTPADVTLTFPVDQHGVLVELGAALGGLENLTVQGPDSGTGYGVLATRGGSIKLTEVIARGFVTGLATAESGTATGVGVTATNNTGTGVRAMTGGTITLSDSFATNNGADGFQSQAGAIFLTNCTASGNTASGFRADRRGTTVVSGTSTDNGAQGLFASEASFLRASGVTTTNNGNFGFYAFTGSVILYTGVTTNTGNGDGTQNLTTNTPDTIGSVIIQ